MTVSLTDADRAQLRASDPGVSAFVDASAGSGKTKLLTDRILRLMLAGADPTKIVCLTFTKATAAEMALRLRAALATWVTASDDDLKVALLRLEVTPTDEVLAFARSLFGVVLDLPGGVNIGTIHSFCQSMLRRFPLEAQVSPHFKIEDESSAAMRRRKARDQVISGFDVAGHVDDLAAEQNDEQFAKAVSELLSDPEALIAAIREYGVEGLIGRQREALGVGHLTEEAVWDRALSPPDLNALTLSLEIVKQFGSVAAAKNMEPGLAWLRKIPEGRRLAFDDWRLVFLTLAGEPRADQKIANKELLKAHPSVLGAIHNEQVRLVELQRLFSACTLARVSAALVSLVAPILAAEEKAKAASGMLDYPDLIVKTAHLLVDPGASWVLFKMDGGIDHILLDEVQDVSPSQWRIIGSLVDDFFSGEAARDSRRTIFAVGDMKQSIFSFQGADLRSFVEWHDILRTRVQQAGGKWVDGELNTSFRSSAGVLDVVDAVFADPLARRGVVFDDEAVIKHQVSRAGQAGSVSVWPLVPKAASPDVPEWEVVDEYHMGLSSRRRLARGLAAWLSRALGNFELYSRQRALRAGDVLVLVRNRNEFGDALVPALKEAGIPVAGLDRVTLADSRAVADLIAFAEAVTLPQNDLAMATYLCSPLGALSDESFMDLALGRDGTLTGALFTRGHERADWQAALNLYVTMQSRVDFVSPFHFFSEILGRHNGRAVMARRLGPDALEPLDEFLAAALRYSAAHTPTLRGFLYSVETSNAEIKRETDVSADAVRIMTVHGAKGLQAPVVILPDTTTQPTVKDKLFWLPGADNRPYVPILCPREASRTETISTEISRMKTEEIEEHNRLLYVAMTRAEDHLIVCGTAPDGVAPEDSWYSSVLRGLDTLPWRDDEALGLEWDGKGRTFGIEQTGRADRGKKAVEADAPAELPAWIGPAPGYVPCPPLPDPDPIERIVPSRIGDDGPANVRTGRPTFGFGAGRAKALMRGKLVHQLLQYLPGSTQQDAPFAAAEFLVGQGVADDEIDPIVEEALYTWNNPEIALVFGPDALAEVPIVGIVGGAEVTGVIDRMHIGPEVVTIVDFKSDRNPPTAGDDIPPNYTKQVSIYCDVLREAYPGRAIRAYLVWTATGAVTVVGDPVPA